MASSCGSNAPSNSGAHGLAIILASLALRPLSFTRGISVRSAYALAATWEFLGFAASALIFLLIGIALGPRQLATFARCGRRLLADPGTHDTGPHTHARPRSAKRSDG
jgi:hypothetical protein